VHAATCPCTAVEISTHAEGSGHQCSVIRAQVRHAASLINSTHMVRATSAPRRIKLPVPTSSAAALDAPALCPVVDHALLPHQPPLPPPPAAAPAPPAPSRYPEYGYGYLHCAPALRLPVARARRSCKRSGEEPPPPPAPSTRGRGGYASLAASDEGRPPPPREMMGDEPSGPAGLL
jgi:hypothetical protein